jgi:uncharacterized protein with PIN domain
MNGPDPIYRAQFRFYAELNDFISHPKKTSDGNYPFNGSPSIKDAIEAQGIPHTEVDLILVNGTSVDFSYRLQDGDTVSVYPVFESLDISTVIRLRQKPLRIVRFILDVHLGKLSRILRMLGFDSLYRNDYDDAEIVTIALKEKRVILTRDRGILKIKAVTHGYWIRSSIPEKQVTEVLDRFDLYSQIHPFYRCMSCNGMIVSVGKTDIEDRLQRKTKQYYDDFSICSACGKLFWKGTHYDRMKTYIDRLMDRHAQPG